MIPTQDRGRTDQAVAFRVVASVAALAGYVYLIGWTVAWVRLGAARLPAYAASAALDDKLVFAGGLRSVGLMGAGVAVLCALAYAAAGRKWEVNAQDWHDIATYRGVANARAMSADGAQREAREAGAAQTRSIRRRDRAQRLARFAARARLGRLADRATALGTRAAEIADAPNSARRLRAVRAARLARVAGALHIRPLARRAMRSGQAHQQASQSPSQAPVELASAELGDGAVRVIAGFNIIVLAGMIGLAVAQAVDLLLPHWWATVSSWAVGFLAVRELLTRWSPLRWGPGTQGVVWVLVAIAATLFSAPIGLLVLTGIGLSTVGRALARLPRPGSPAALVASPLPWVLLTACALFGAAYHAVPPVSFPRVVVATAGGSRVGGYLGRTAAGVYLVTCTPLADATSTDERVVLVAAGDARATTLGGVAFSLDSGDRPSLATLALHTLGIAARPPTWLRVDLRSRRGTCAGVDPSGLTVGTEDPALGPGAIAGPPPPQGRAHDGEPAIEQTSPVRVARLARQFQPTVEVTVADRVWPVSVGAVLADRGPVGQPTCLIAQRRPTSICPPKLSDLAAAGNPGDFLRYPAGLGNDPTNQFRAFETGQYVTPGPLHQWLADPGLLDPWGTAQVYFYYAGPTRFSGSAQSPVAPVSDPKVADNLLGLQYWFFYPTNYYPTVVRPGLMNEAPLAGDVANTDLHQGDWEHITVLLEPGTLRPLWIYTARHSDEGQFIPWSSRALAFDQGHPIVQAGFGGHPTYPNTCAQHPRSKHGLRNLVSDWTVCGSGRYAFRAATTPLVDIARAPWACWRGHFGVATPTEVSHARLPESSVARALHSYYLVAGPRSPLWQAENGHLAVDGDPKRDIGVCSGGAAAAAENGAPGSGSGP